MSLAKRPRTLRISLDDVIVKLNAMHRTSKRAEEIPATAVTQRSCSGRDRKRAMRGMATT